MSPRARAQAARKAAYAAAAAEALIGRDLECAYVVGHLTAELALAYARIAALERAAKD